jgi:hypothetical protein
MGGFPSRGAVTGKEELGPEEEKEDEEGASIVWASCLGSPPLGSGRREAWAPFERIHIPASKTSGDRPGRWMDVLFINIPFEHGH